MQILSVLREMREVTAACFRLIGESPDEGLPIRLTMELQALEVPPGFGERCQELISEMEAYVPKGQEN